MISSHVIDCRADERDNIGGFQDAAFPGLCMQIGSLAVQLGLLDQSAILSIIRRRRQGELFGEAAVRLGYLETWDIMILCGRQKLLNCPIGKYFIEEGILSEKEIAESLDGLSRHNLFVALRSRKAN